MANKYDFSNAQLPTLGPLENSFTATDYEREFKDLVIKLFNEYVAGDLFDQNVTGMAHLGSFSLVQKSVNADGLALLDGAVYEEEATRYVYRAWKGTNAQGRGKHFLRTYLQVIYPNLTEVLQLWHKKNVEYPNGLVSMRDGVGVKPDPETQYLTSRVEIALDLGLVTRSITQLTNTIQAVIPARFVPHFRFCIIFDVTLEYEVDGSLYMNKYTSGWLEWCGLIITTRPERMWQLGVEGEPGNPKIKACRATGTESSSKSIVINYPVVHKIGEPGLKLDGTWVIPPRAAMVADCEIVITRTSN